MRRVNGYILDFYVDLCAILTDHRVDSRQLQDVVESFFKEHPIPYVNYCDIVTEANERRGSVAFYINGKSVKRVGIIANLLQNMWFASLVGAYGDELNMESMMARVEEKYQLEKQNLSQDCGTFGICNNIRRNFASRSDIQTFAEYARALKQEIRQAINILYRALQDRNERTYLCDIYKNEFLQMVPQKVSTTKLLSVKEIREQKEKQAEEEEKVRQSLEQRNTIAHSDSDKVQPEKPARPKTSASGTTKQVKGAQSEGNTDSVLNVKRDEEIQRLKLTIDGKYRGARKSNTRERRQKLEQIVDTYIQEDESVSMAKNVENGAKKEDFEERYYALVDAYMALENTTAELRNKNRFAINDILRSLFKALTSKENNNPLGELYLIAEKDDGVEFKYIQYVIKDLFSALENSIGLELIEQELGKEIIIDKNNIDKYKSYGQIPMSIGDKGILCYPGFKYDKDIICKPMIKVCKQTKTN